MTSAEIKQAMQAFAPIEYNGAVYERITAYIYRIIKDPHTGKFRAIFQVELLAKSGNSVTIASTDKIRVYEREK